MRLSRLTTWIILLLIVPYAAFAGKGISGEVVLDSGPVRGKVADDGARSYLGIPYAAPPVGGLRWKPPQKAVSWTQTREAVAFGPACPQSGTLESSSSEDCLSLNVWTPAREAGAKLPVMVWIHGGGFNFGASSQPEYDGRNLARQGVVVVTVNYRLGPLGFLAHPKLAGESETGSSGNYGLLDQIAALAWVRRNIAAFGGAPDRVTIFGQSAGSRSVSLLMLSPMSEGLFQRAIAQSGGPIIGSEYLTPAFNGDWENVSRMGQQLSVRLGCDKADDELACMRAKSAGEVVKAADCRTSIFEDGLFFAPVFDGRVLPRDPAAAYRHGRQHRLPMILGSTGNEGTTYLHDEHDITIGKYDAFLQSRFKAKAAAARILFPAASDADVPRAIDRCITVATNAQPARFVARAMERLPAKAYLYRFTRQPNTARARELGAFHGVDLAYVFGNMTAADGYTDRDRELSRQVMAYWVNFARTGNPNGPGLVVWPDYDIATDTNLDFADDIHLEQHLYQTEADFIDGASQFGLDK